MIGKMLYNWSVDEFYYFQVNVFLKFFQASSIVNSQKIFTYVCCIGVSRNVTICILVQL